MSKRMPETNVGEEASRIHSVAGLIPQRPVPHTMRGGLAIISPLISLPLNRAATLLLARNEIDAESMTGPILDFFCPFLGKLLES